MLPRTYCRYLKCIRSAHLGAVEYHTSIPGAKVRQVHIECPGGKFASRGETCTFDGACLKDITQEVTGAVGTCAVR